MELKIELAELQKRKLFVATPMYGGMCAGMYTRSISDLAAICAKYQIQLQLYFLFNESLITRARNYCVDEFMRSNASHLMFIDSDIGFNPQDVIAMLAMMTDESDYDVMGGPYPKKCISWEKIVQAVNKGVADDSPSVLEKYVGDYVFNPKHGQNEIPLNRPVEVRELGTGFMMIRRKTFEEYQKIYTHQWYRPDHVRTAEFDGSREIMAYFDCIIDRGYQMEQLDLLLKDVAEGKDPAELQKRAQFLLNTSNGASKRYLSEDYMFCYNVDKMGLKNWLCPWMQLQHVGSYVFSGSLADLASVGASATADAGQLKKKK
jgi:glycosyltransferase involved in cell wall biosynthesis